MRLRLTLEDYTKGILEGDRIILGRAITIVESRLPQDKKLAAEILQHILPHTGNTLRIGVTGVPGAGKSTFIETLGKHITSLGKRVAVLAIDPSSQRSHGSILGDKTRMDELSHDPLAFIRPSATGLSLGGVARNTRESMLLCEAGGYEVILIETVGVGQSETIVKGMTDFFLLVLIAGAGDELQGMKKGIMEMADIIAINKADGNNIEAANQALNVYRNALHLFPKGKSGYTSQVVACSALNSTGVTEIWNQINEYAALTTKNGFFTKNRQLQNLDWMHNHIRQSLEDQFYTNPLIKTNLSNMERAVRENKELPISVAQQLIDLFLKKN